MPTELSGFQWVTTWCLRCFILLKNIKFHQESLKKWKSSQKYQIATRISYSRLTIHLNECSTLCARDIHEYYYSFHHFQAPNNKVCLWTKWCFEKKKDKMKSGCKWGKSSHRPRNSYKTGKTEWHDLDYVFILTYFQLFLNAFRLQNIKIT
jgi:hypothetical protein